VAEAKLWRSRDYSRELEHFRLQTDGVLLTSVAESGLDIKAYAKQ
jgi:hypothetical protein